MAGQYRKIAEYDTVYYASDSPVLIEKMRLQHDLIYNVNVLQITFRNVDPQTVYGLGIAINLRNEEGRLIHKEIEFNYYGLEASTGKSFGSDVDIVVEPEAMRFEVSVLRADLEEGKRFHGRVLLETMPEPQPLSTLGEWELPFLDRLAELKPKLKAHCAPENGEGYWRCICKRIYPYSITACPVCRIKTTELLTIVPNLQEEKRQREEEEARLEQERLEEERRQREREEQARREEEERRRQEEEERRRQEEEERLRQEELKRQKKEKLKKRLKIAAISLAGVLCVAALAVYLIPKILPSDEGTAIEETVDTPAPTVTVKPTPVPTAEPVPADEMPEEVKSPILLLCGDLDETETKTLWRLFGTAVTAPEEYDTYYIGTASQKVYMEGYLGEDNVEPKSISSVLILPKEEGYGLRLSLFNITYCTEDMYRTLLTEAGITDADVVIAAPDKASGSSALAGLWRLAGHGSDYAGTGIGTAVSNTRVNIRNAPSVKGARYTMIDPGTEVEVLEFLDTGWMKIVWPDSLDGTAYTAYNVGDEHGLYYVFTPKS